jgi:mannose-1-phosphate guanylyltransferase/phosphomannomutase
MNQSKNAERAVEQVFFREDFRRAYLDEIGQIQYARRPLETYIEGFFTHIDEAAIRAAGFRIVIDYSHGLAGDAFSQILNRLGVDVIPLNARMDETKLAMLHYEFRANLERMAKIVGVLDADLGIQMDVAGEKLYLVDEQGRILDDVTAAALMLELGLQNHPGSIAVAPVTMPSGFDTIAAWRQSKLQRISNNSQSLMAAADNPAILMGVDGNGSFIFPAFHPAVDGMIAAAKLLEYLAKYRRDIAKYPIQISEIVRYLPPFRMAAAPAQCPTAFKGAVMRRLNERYAVRGGDQVEGVRIQRGPGEWVHIAPDPEAPFFSIVAEAGSIERAQLLVAEYRAVIEEMVGINGAESAVEPASLA